VLSVFVGIRPLVKSGDGLLTAALSRDHTIHFDASGLMTTTGGKWTTYLNMAEHAVDQAADFARLEERPCVTRSLNVHGFHSNADRFGALSVYGSDALAIQELMRTTPSWSEPLHPQLPYVAAEVVGLPVTKWHEPSRMCLRAVCVRCSSARTPRKPWRPKWPA
jgi:glycerol-3-phosphate dehydrogenase